MNIMGRLKWNDTCSPPEVSPLESLNWEVYRGLTIVYKLGMLYTLIPTSEPEFPL